MYINAGKTLHFWYSVNETGSYNNCNIIDLTPKSIPFETFYEIHKVVLDGIIENMASVVQ